MCNIWVIRNVYVYSIFLLTFSLSKFHAADMIDVRPKVAAVVWNNRIETSQKADFGFVYDFGVTLATLSPCS